jgi:hypothetical protein
MVIGCGEDTDDIMEEGDISDAPPLPPDQSMTVDLAVFSGGEPEIPEIPVPDNPVPAGPSAGTPVYGENYANAMARVATINAAVVSALTFPAGLFMAAKENEPVLQPDGSWLWNYNVEYDYFLINAKLTCVEEADKAYWSMKTSINSPIVTVQEFEWYTGVCSQDNTSGSWQFLDMFTPDENNPIVKIDWSIQPLKGEAMLDIENIDTRESCDYTGDILEYCLTAEMASMSFTDISEDEICEIEWDTQTGAGSITVPSYKDGEQACWDADKQDTVCN